MRATLAGSLHKSNSEMERSNFIEDLGQFCLYCIRIVFKIGKNMVVCAVEPMLMLPSTRKEKHDDPASHQQLNIVPQNFVAQQYAAVTMSQGNKQLTLRT